MGVRKNLECENLDGANLEIFIKLSKFVNIWTKQILTNTNSNYEDHMTFSFVEFGLYVLLFYI